MKRTLKSPKQLIYSAVLQWVNYYRSNPLTNIKELAEAQIFVPIVTTIQSFKTDFLPQSNGSKLQIRLKYLNNILQGIRNILKLNGCRIKEQIQLQLSFMEICNGQEKQILLLVGLILATFLGSSSKITLVSIITKLSEQTQTTFIILIEDALTLTQSIDIMNPISEQSDSYYKQLTFCNNLEYQIFHGVQESQILKIQTIEEKLFQYNIQMNNLKRKNQHLRRENIRLNKKCLQSDLVLVNTVRQKNRKIVELHTKNKIISKDLLDQKISIQPLLLTSKRTSLRSSIIKQNSKQNTKQSSHSITHNSTRRQPNVLPIIKQRISLRDFFIR